MLLCTMCCLFVCKCFSGQLCFCTLFLCCAPTFPLMTCVCVFCTSCCGISFALFLRCLCILFASFIMHIKILERFRNTTAFWRVIQQPSTTSRSKVPLRIHRLCARCHLSCQFGVLNKIVLVSDMESHDYKRFIYRVLSIALGSTLRLLFDPLTPWRSGGPHEPVIRKYRTGLPPLRARLSWSDDFTRPCRVGSDLPRGCWSRSRSWSNF